MPMKSFFAINGCPFFVYSIKYTKNKMKIKFQIFVLGVVGGEEWPADS
jgi:hypothetical protein